jgi:1,4-alpha-glucan branching enzyme
MKILLGVPEYPPYHVGGGGEVYRNLAEQYKSLGHEVVVIYGYYPTKTWNQEIAEYTDEQGIVFYQIPELPYPKPLPFLRTVMPCNLNAYFKLKKIIEKEKPDKAHLHGYGLLFINILAKKIYKQGIDYVFTIHGYPETQNKHNIVIRSIWSIYIQLVMNVTLKRAKKVTCVSKYINDDPRNIRRENSVVIYNGINLDDFKNIKSDIDVRKKHNIDIDQKIFLSLGRITEMKGFQDVINLIPELQARGMNVRYLIAGEDDGYKKTLEGLIDSLNLHKNVEFVGFLNLEEKKQYIDQCDIFAIPSLSEPFGLVALEGMLLDKVILTAGKGALNEVLSDYDKVIHMSEKNIDIKSNDKLRTQVRKFGLFSKFDWSDISKMYINEIL